MEKKFEDDELDKLLDEQYIREAEMIVEALFSNEDSQEYEETEEEARASYNKLVERLKAEGIYREDRENEKDDDTLDAEDISDEKPVPANDEKPEPAKVVPFPASEAAPEEEPSRPKRKKMHKIAKVAGWAVACAAGVFLASMTSEANRQYFIKKVNYFMGNDTRINVENIERSVLEGQDEIEAIEDIEEKLNVNVPQFMYRPKQFSFLLYRVDTISMTASVEYEYEDEIIDIFISKNDDYSSSNNIGLRGDTVEDISISDEKMQGKLITIQSQNDEKASYVAVWKNEEVFYQISGKIDKKIFKRIINEMIF